MPSKLRQHLQRREFVYPLLLIASLAIAFAVFFVPTHFKLIPRTATTYTWDRVPRTLSNIVGFVQDQLPSVQGDQPNGDWPADALPKSLQSDVFHDAIDPWGNPYRIVVRNDPEDPTGHFVGSYSTGADGASSTGGNDEDDINTWGQLSAGQVYYDEIKRWRFKRNVTAAAWKSLLIYPLLILIYEAFRGRLRYRAGTCQHCGYDLRGTPNDTCPECGYFS